jgi:hypothetical protein
VVHCRRDRHQRRLRATMCRPGRGRGRLWSDMRSERCGRQARMGVGASWLAGQRVPQGAARHRGFLVPHLGGVWRTRPIVQGRELRTHALHGRRDPSGGLERPRSRQRLRRWRDVRSGSSSYEPAPSPVDVRRRVSRDQWILAGWWRAHVSSSSSAFASFRSAVSKPSVNQP